MPINLQDQKPFNGLTFKAANGWRGPGALAIALAHFALVLDYFNTKELQPVALMVDLFFVLSGFVIAQAYSTKLTKSSAIPEYIIRRFGRIWPLQAATLAVLVVYELLKLVLASGVGVHFSSPPFGADSLTPWQAIPTNLLLIQSLGLHERETWNFPSWSLCVEFVTYASFAALCLVGPVLRRFFSIIIIAVSLAILLLLAPRDMRSTYDYGLFRCLAGFLAGTLCHDVVGRWRIPRWPLPTLVEIITIALVGFWLTHSVHTMRVFAAPLIFSLFLYIFVAGRGAFSRGLASAPMQIFAEWSFAIYMVHAPVLIFMLAALHAIQHVTGHLFFVMVPNPGAAWANMPAFVEVIHIGSPAEVGLMALIYTSTVVVVAAFAHRVVEKPGRALFGSLAKRSMAWRLPTFRAVKSIRTAP